MAELADDQLVQLAHFELEGSLLAGGGVPLPTRFEGRPVVGPESDPYPVPDEPPLPATGWRVVHDRTIAPYGVGGRPPRHVVLAAPSGEPGWWALLNLEEDRQRWCAHAMLERHQVRPSRAGRRRHLRLFWPDGEVSARAGAAAEQLATSLRVTLTNIGGDGWQCHEQEGAPVVVHLTDLVTGERLPARSGFAYAPLMNRPFTLAPGDSAHLDVVVLTARVEALPSGTYGLAGTWLAVDLAAEPARLRLG